MAVATVVKPETPEVAGQLRYIVLCCTGCPCCGAAIYPPVEGDADVPQWYVCGVCGCAFEA
jgi:hypothetical protein